MKPGIASKVLGHILFVALMFAVLFDPTEMAIGADLVALSPFWLSVAEMIGNVVWILGLLYCLVILGSVLILFNEDLYKESLEKTPQQQLKAYRKTWYDYPMFLFYLASGVLALGSGFWFTGSTSIIGQLLMRAIKQRVRNDKNINLEAE